MQDTSILVKSSMFWTISILGVDEENMELVVGIIDFMRQYDILKQMERVGRSFRWLS
jgi:hypothetical protein